MKQTTDSFDVLLYCCRRSSRRSDEILWEEEPLPSPETSFAETNLFAFGWNTTSTKPLEMIKKEIIRVLKDDQVEIQIVNEKLFFCRIRDKSVFFEIEVANLPRFSVCQFFLHFNNIL